MANPVTWFEIIGKDSAGLQKFYREVFAWKLAPPVTEMGNYSLLEGHEPGIGGGIGEGDARVTVYIEVDDPQAYLDKATSAGAKVLMPVSTITPTTTIAMLADPGGNVVGLMKANPRPRKVTRRTASKTTRRTTKTTAKRGRATTRRSGTRRRR